MQKVTYEYKGVKITIEAEYTASEIDVAEAILRAKENLPKVFSKVNLNELIDHQDIIPTVLTPKDIKDILKISDKKSYEFIKEAIDKEAFPVMKIDRVYRIPKRGFLKWLLGYESEDLRDISFKVLTTSEIKDILNVCEKTVYTILYQAPINNWFEVKRVGRSYRVPAQPFLKWMDQLESIESRFE
ncbi:MAG: helix-turn-helix domain-containing protein [Peptostreptococcaceae bacterium]